MVDLVILRYRGRAGHPEPGLAPDRMDQGPDSDQGDDGEHEFTEQAQQQQLLLRVLMGGQGGWILQGERIRIRMAPVERVGMGNHIPVGHHMDVPVGRGIEEEPQDRRKHQQKQ